MGSGEPLIILHGLFGMLDNWVTLGKRFSEDFEVFLIDQRNHGKSPHSIDISYPLMAEDLAEFISEHKIVNPSIIGHSMGGKIAMQYALNYTNDINKLIIADIAPRWYDANQLDIINALRLINPANLKTRQEAADILNNENVKPQISFFLLKNLERNGNIFSWKFNLAAIANNIEKLSVRIESHTSFIGNTLFLKGQFSNYIREEDEQYISELFPNHLTQQIPNAGHWLNAEQPDIFFEEVIRFIK